MSHKPEGPDRAQKSDELGVRPDSNERYWPI